MGSTTTKSFAGGGAWMIAAALQVIPNTWPNLLRPHPWAVGFFVLLGALMFAYAAFGNKHSSGSATKQETRGDNSHAMHADRGSSIHYGDIHYGADTKELEEKVRRLENTDWILVNGIGSQDPLVYLDIDPHSDRFRDRFVCHNRGKSTVHDVQIQPIKLANNSVTFAPISVIAAGEKESSSLAVEGASPFLKRDIFYWLLQDWSKANPNSVPDKWAIPMQVTYSNALGNKRYTGTMQLVFHPIKYQMNEKLNKTEKAWEFTAPQYSAEM